MTLISHCGEELYNDIMHNMDTDFADSIKKTAGLFYYITSIYADHIYSHCNNNVLIIACVTSD